jgi:hypothetical protein
MVLTQQAQGEPLMWFVVCSLLGFVPQRKPAKTALWLEFLDENYIATTKLNYLCYMPIIHLVKQYFFGVRLCLID